MAGYSNRTWSCPFFKWDEKKKHGPAVVHCEGGAFRFPDWRTFREYADAFCSDPAGWEGCSVAQALKAYWERQEEQ